jgi:hypothetical protein
MAKRKAARTDIDDNDSDDSDESLDDITKGVPEEEVELIDTFLTQFVNDSSSGSKVD